MLTSYSIIRPSKEFVINLIIMLSPIESIPREKKKTLTFTRNYQTFFTKLDILFNFLKKLKINDVFCILPYGQKIYLGV